MPVHISASNDDQFHIRQDLHAAGSSNAEARRRALKIDDVARIDGNTLYVDNYIGIDRQTKIRDQHTSVFIEVPVGKSVRIGEDMYPVDGDKIESNDYPWNMNGLTWVMTKDGLICPEYDAAHPKVIEDAQQSVGDAQDVKDEIKKPSKMPTRQSMKQRMKSKSGKRSKRGRQRSTERSKGTQSELI